MIQSSNPERTVPTRRMSFEESLRDLPRHFAADGDLIASHIAAGLSAVFPDGEDFFVRSVRHFRSEITDPKLKTQVAGFIGQEAMHGRQHRAFNDRLDQLGYPTRRVEWLTKRGLGHALEESEHKAVAFDVYKAVGGSERTRVFTMKLLRFGFVLGMTAQVTLSLLGDRATYRPGNLRRSLRTFRRSPLANRELWRQLKDYDRPDFHPDDSDTTQLVEHWREVLFGEHGILNDRLVTAAA